MDAVINKAEQFDAESQESASVEQPIEPQTEISAAETRAAVLLKMLEGGAKLLADSRLMIDDEELASGTASLAPVIQKYNLAGEGNGNIPFAEEVAAGFYLGGLWKRFRRALAELRAADKAKKDEQKQASSSNGDQREHRTEEQSRPVPGKIGVREEPNPKKEGWLG
jgi:hypothetical protein